MRGRKPTPTALRLIQGNPGRRPLPSGEPRPKAKVPSRPKWLEPEARREWTRVCRELAALGILSILDRAMLALYCVAWGDYVELVALIKKEGWTVGTGEGGVKRHPAASSLREAHDRVRSAASELGLTPAARVRLAYPKDHGFRDPLEDLERRRQARQR